MLIEFFNSAREFFMMFHGEIIYFSYVALGFGIFQNFIYLMQIPLAAAELKSLRLKKRDSNSGRFIQSDITLPITIIIPAYNEERTISKTALSTLATQYPSFEVIIVNDGSKDKTMQVLIDEFGLAPSKRYYENKLDHAKIKNVYASKIYANLIVVDKENGGRSDALNAGIDVSRNPIFCTLDADSLLDPTALLTSTLPFIEKPDEVVATGGTVRIINGSIIEDGEIKDLRLPTKLVPLFQVIEYIRAFLMGRLSWSHLGMVTIISGAFAIFKRDFAIQVGGFNTKTIGEDFELVMRIHKYCCKNKIKYEVRFVPDPVCWTEAPETLKVLKSQRIRWQQGALEVILRNVDMIFNPKYGRIGMVAMPIMFVMDVLGPIIELLSYILVPIFYILGFLNAGYMILFLAVFFVLGIFISTMSLVLEEISLRRFKNTRELFIMGFVAIIENFGYRQLNSMWRIVGWWRFIRGKQEWGEMTRVKK